MTPDDPVMTPEATSEYLGVSPLTLKDWRSQGRGPDFIRISGQLVRYRKSSVDRWLAAATVENDTTKSDAGIRRSTRKRRQ